MFIPVSVAGAVFSSDRTKILLIKRRDVPVWALPGGGIDPGETPEAAILREILEETGFTVKIDRLVGNYIPMNRLAKPTQLFACSVVGGEAAVSAETSAVAFFSVDALPALIPPPYRDWIGDALIDATPVTKRITSVNYWRFTGYLLTHPILVARFLLARLGLPLNH